MSEILGQQLCDFCPGERLVLGIIPTKTEEYFDRHGAVAGSFVTEERTITIPTALRDVVGMRGNLYLLRCGHISCGVMRSAQEWLTLGDGIILRGISMVGAIRE